MNHLDQTFPVPVQLLGLGNYKERCDGKGRVEGRVLEKGKVQFKVEHYGDLFL